MSIKEFFEKLFTAKNGVRNLIILIILIIGLFFVPAIIDYVEERKKCAHFINMGMSCEFAKELYGDDWDELNVDDVN